MSRPVWTTFAVALAIGLLTARLSTPPVPLATALDTRTSRTRTSPASPPPLRVRLGESDSWQIRVDGPYQITRPNDWQVLAQGPSLPTSTVTTTDQGMRVASRDFEADTLLLRVVRPGSLWVGQTRYRGDLHLARAKGQRLLAVNRVDLEDYLASVVNGEMPASFPDAARRAQAIAARTYAVYHMKTAARGQNYDVRSDQQSQVYRGMEYSDASGRRLAAETPDSRRIVADSSGLLLTYEGRLFCAFYSAVCGGHTVRGEDVFPAAAPPLVGGPCGYCEEGPNHHWEQTFSWPEREPKLREYLAASGRRMESITSLNSADQSSPALGEIEVLGQPAPVRVSSAQFRRHVLNDRPLPSDRFVVWLEDDVLRVTGRGWGHGVGMCQWGARGYGLAGATCPEILAYYYPGCQLVRLR